MSHDLRITAIVAAYNEADIIGQTVRDLVRQRIHVHLLDNRSTDGTAEAVRPYTASGFVHIEVFPADDVKGNGVRYYEHARIMARKQELARELDSDWIIAHDADEFRESPWANVTLREGIELVDRSGWNAINFAVLNFWPTHDQFDPADDIREAFRHYELGGPWDELQVKCWKKASDVELVSSGGHDARFESRRVFPIRFILRHYPIRGQAHGLRKVFEERKPRFVESERNRGWHVQYDSLEADHQFIRDPRSLIPYEPERARLDQHIRDADAIQRELERWERHASDLHTQQQDHLRLTERLATEVDDHNKTVERLAAEVSARVQEGQRLAADHLRVQSELAAQIRGLDNELQNQLSHVQSLTRELDEIRQSYSWKLTGPLRTAGRLLRGR